MVEIAEINFAVLAARLKPCHPVGAFGTAIQQTMENAKRSPQRTQRKSPGEWACNAGPSTVLSFRERNDNFAQEDNALKLAAGRRRYA